MRFLRCLSLLVSLPLLAHAAKPQHEPMEGYDDLSAGKCRSTSLTQDGVLAAGPATGKLADLDAAEAWSILPQADGSLLVGTAPEGKLLRVSSTGAVKQLAKFEESHLYAMALGPKGEIYVGTSPDGKIYLVGPDGKTDVYFEPREKYIWAMVVAPDGTLYAGTGTKGKIYRVTGKGKGEIWYDSNETHIRALALEKSGALLAGSSDSGYLYRITGKDAGLVLADTGKEEVNQIHVAPNGDIYFTATGAAKAASPADESPDADKKSSADDSAGLLQLRDMLVTDGQHGGAAPALPPAKPGGGSRLYLLNASLYPQVLFDTKETILSLGWSDRDACALVGTGDEGYTYEVTPHGDATRLCKIESDSVTAITTAGGDTILATSNPGRLFRLGRETSSPGIYESDTIDSETFARWGSVTLGATDSGAVKILTRSGNTSKPDKTWYAWSETNNGESQSPPARYLQVQLLIGAGTVDKIDVCYLAKNLPPHIDAVKILPVGTGFSVLQSPLPTAPPRTADQLLSEPDQSEEPKTPTRWETITAHGLRTVTWKASDPNDDELTYAVSWRKKGETSWHELARDLKETVLSWDTSGWVDGKYELKVVASDAADNAPGEELEDESISRELVIDNTPPVIHILAQNGGSVEFTVSDDLSGLQSVTVSSDGKEYHELPPVNGILDAGMKRFLAKVKPGEPLFIRAEDGSGNVTGTQVGG